MTATRSLHTVQRRRYLEQQAAAQGHRDFKALVERTFTDPELWGKDHLSTLLYLETRCVDHSGYIDQRQMRGRDEKYPTRLADGTEISMHSDFDCVQDMIAFGYVERVESEDLRERFKLTDRGWTKAQELRRKRAEKALER